METRKAIDGKAAIVMALLCLVWSLQQIGIKATAHDISPVLQIALRSGVAAVLVALLMLFRREKPVELAASWRPGLLAGALFALEYVLLGAGLLHTSAAHAVVFLYTGPLFVALGLHLKLPAERLAPLQWLGVALAFGGIAVAFALDTRPGGTAGTHGLAGDLLCLAAGAAWGATTVVVRCSSLSRLPATQVVLYQLGTASVLLLLSAVAMGQTVFMATPVAVGNLVFQALIVSFASLLAWFHLLRHYLASRLGVFSFLTPLFGVLLGAALLDEHITGSFVLGAALVLAGIVLVSGHGWISAAWAARKTIN